MKTAEHTATIAAVVVRLIAGAFFLLTAIYALLVYLPFSYQQFILPDVLPGVSTFVAWHHVLLWIVLISIAATSIDDLRHRTTRFLSAVLLGGGLLTAIYLTARPLLPGLPSDRSSLVVCLLALVPIFWMAGLDAMSGRGRILWSEEDADEDRRIFETAVWTALFVSLTYFAIGAVRVGAPTLEASAAPTRALLIALVWSVAAHLVLFGALFLALLAVRGVVRVAGGSTFLETILIGVFAATLAALAIKQIVFSAISFTGPVATAVAIAFALSVAGLLAGIIVRLQRRSRRPIRSGLEFLTAPLAFLGAARSVRSEGTGSLESPPHRRAPAGTVWRRVLGMTAIAAAAWLFVRQTSMMDWNYLLQKMSAITIWIVAFAAVYAIRDRVPGTAGRTAILWLLLGAAVPAVTYRTLDTLQGRVPGWLGLPGLEVRSVLDGHAGIDPSFKVIYETVSATSTGDDRAFYDLLQRNTNIPREVRVDPVEVALVDVLAPRTGYAPHIFLFVIDSLRQDYVSPYNPRVTFTPAIDAFARDSVVFKRAFTRYGATGLSEPSIWVGGLLVHKQYVMPFAPMNALHKLLAVDGYQRFISRDTILRTLLPVDDMDVELDAGVPNMSYDLCRSLTDLRAKVLNRSHPERPIFAYTQPQNIHVSLLTREGVSVPAGAAYPGFYPPYASRIQQMDVCFGEFVQFLRDEDLYDDSLIVLTSDHGDSLGESGRWGHAYTIFPEILRIPLVVHLPRVFRERLTCDVDAVASLVDITPTLYYLLGHRPVLNRPIFGRPLCTETAQERAVTRRDSYMVASSYGPVYGIVRSNGRWLYIADAVNYTDHYFELTADPAGSPQRVTPAVRSEYQQLIREEIEEVNRFYFPKRPSAP